MDIIAIITYVNYLMTQAQRTIDGAYDDHVVVGVDVIQGICFARVAVPAARTEVLLSFNGEYMYVSEDRVASFSAYVATAHAAAAHGMPMTKHVTHDYITIEVGGAVTGGIMWGLAEPYEYCDDDYEYSRLETQEESDAADRADEYAQERMMAACEW